MPPNIPSLVSCRFFDTSVVNAAVNFLGEVVADATLQISVVETADTAAPFLCAMAGNVAAKSLRSYGTVRAVMSMVAAIVDAAAAFLRPGEVGLASRPSVHNTMLGQRGVKGLR